MLILYLQFFVEYWRPHGVRQSRARVDRREREFRQERAENPKRLKKISDPRPTSWKVTWIKNGNNSPIEFGSDYTQWRSQTPQKIRQILKRFFFVFFYFFIIILVIAFLIQFIYNSS